MSTENNNTGNLEYVIRNRVFQRVPFNKLFEIGITEFYVGGNCLNRSKPNDIDIFPVKKEAFDNIVDKIKEAEDFGKIVSETKNATTVLMSDTFGNTTAIQFCTYHHESLEELVSSFDFAHIQVGAKVVQGEDLYECDVYFTPKYTEMKLQENTQYTKSEYPLSSLIRTFKYMKRRDFSGKSYITSVFDILIDIIERGFEDYNDFKDQLDAVDLGLLPEDMNEIEFENLKHLFSLLEKK